MVFDDATILIKEPDNNGETLLREPLQRSLLIIVTVTVTSVLRISS